MADNNQLPTIQDVMADPKFQAITDPKEKQMALATLIQQGRVQPPQSQIQSTQSPLPGEDFTSYRQRLTTQQPDFQALSGPLRTTAAAGVNVAGTAGGAALGQLAGVPTLGAMAGGGLSEFLNQKLGLSDPSPTNIAINAGLPAAGPILKSILLGGAGIGAPGLVREAGVEAAASRLGTTPNAVKQLFTTPASRQLFNAAMQEGPIETEGIVNVLKKTAVEVNPYHPVENPAGMANAPVKAGRAVNNLLNKYSNMPQTDYGDVVKELQALKGKADSLLEGANPDTNAAKALYEARAKILDQLDKVSPTIKAANAAYRREQAQLSITTALRGANPGPYLRNAFAQDKISKDAFTGSELDDIYAIADKIGRTGGAAPAGEASRIVSNAAGVLADMIANKPGRFILRQLIGPNGVIAPSAIPVAVGTWRAYQAQQGQ